MANFQYATVQDRTTKNFNVGEHGLNPSATDMTIELLNGFNKVCNMSAQQKQAPDLSTPSSAPRI